VDDEVGAFIAEGEVVVNDASVFVTVIPFEEGVQL
jgi:hypothetical protein